MIKLFYILLISCYCTNSICQSELEEIRDNSYGTAGEVDLSAMGFEDCDLIAIDEDHNQYIINYNLSTISIIKLQENGAQIMDYGINGKLTMRNAGGYHKLVRTGPNDITPLEEIQEKRNNFSIYPNPTSSLIVIETANTLEDDILCKVFDLKGNIMTAQHFRNSKFVLDLSDYPQGAYFVNLISSTVSTSQLVLKY